MIFELPWRTENSIIENRAARSRCWNLCYGVACLVILAAAGCSDGTVDARGRVLIDGAPVVGGRLLLTPVAGGPRAFSLVTPEGEFALRTAGESEGAFPGSYRMTLYQPLGEKLKAQLTRELAGELAATDMTAVYRGPREQLLVIPADGSDQLEIDVRASAGWKCSISD
jgi:hypothetical protein